MRLFGSLGVGFLVLKDRQGSIVSWAALRVHIFGQLINITAFGTPHIVFTPRSADFAGVSTLGK
jgi:hypothetical protein